ncbi:MAG: Radical domain protein [Myxococcaceae bacterium]|nr:Radical domain protein [Myxococcaceae bacterium]
MSSAALSSQARAESRVRPRIGGVTYLNAWPVLYGLMLGREPEHIRMAYPSVLAERLVSRECDLALAPVATLALRSGFELAPRICIGADGAVASVLIVSERPIEELDTLLLDTQSRTSVVLAQLLAAHLRGGRAIALSAADHARIEREARGKTGAVVIGDRANEVRDQYAHVIDMGEAWKAWTGLPFVFAAWIAQRGVLDDGLVEMLERSLEHGLSARREIAHLWVAQHGGETSSVEHYLTENIRYRIDERYRAGLSEFLARAQAAKLIDPVQLRFYGG